MAEFKHLAVVKFKEEVVVEEIVKGLQKLVSELPLKSFEWGEDIESPDMLRQGFTHAFLLTFSSKDEFTAFMSHPKHVEFTPVFSAAVDKIMVLDFPVAATP